MTVDEIIATFATIHDRAALVALLTPLRLPRDLPPALPRTACGPIQPPGAALPAFVAGKRRTRLP